MQVRERNIAAVSKQSEMGEKGTLVALYDTHKEAEKGIRNLQGSGFDLKQLSIIGKDGASWGGLWSLLHGSAFLVVPDIGPLFTAGPLVAQIAGEGAPVVGGLSPVGAGLCSVGIPQDSIFEYETLIKAGKFVVIAHGPLDEVDRTRIALAKTRHQGLKEHRF